MVSAVVAACAALAACGVVLLAVRRGRIQAQRQLDAVLERVDEHLRTLSASIATAVDTALESRSSRSTALLTLDFDEILDALVAEAASRTGADAAILRVEGPAGRPTIAAFGTGAERETLDRSFAPPGEPDFHAALIDWTYSAAGEPADARFASALVVPLAGVAGTPGTLAVYSRASPFGREHASALDELLRDAAVGLSNARRFAELEARVNVDGATGIASRRGYEIELGRVTSRSNRTGRPLSVVVVSAGEHVADVARLVADVTRRSDIPCRRGDRELAILLPGTASSGAAVLKRRIEDEAKRRFATGTSTVTVGLVEHAPDESPDALDERIDDALGRTPRPRVSRLDGPRTNVALESAPPTSATDEHALRHDTLEALERERAGTGGFGRSLAVVVLELGGLDTLTRAAGSSTADEALGRFAGRLDRSLGAGSAHRLDRTTFALVLPGSGVHDAEGLVDALQSSLEPPHGEEGLVLSAGITELGDDDEAEAGLARAEHALWQAAQAGSGTVVVAVPNRRPSPPHAP